MDIDKESTALLVLECQIGIMSRIMPSDRDRLLSNLPDVIAAAREAGIPVIYVVILFREGYPEISPRNARFASQKEAGRNRQSAPDSGIRDELRPQPGDIIVTKKRVSAFTGSDLEVLLRSRGIDTIVLSGISSLGSIESTSRFAFDMDYRIFTIGDCCADRDPKAHEIALAMILPWTSTVCSKDDFIAAISQ